MQPELAPNAARAQLNGASSLDMWVHSAREHVQAARSYATGRNTERGGDRRIRRAAHLNGERRAAGHLKSFGGSS